MRASYYVMSDLERQLTQLYEKKKTRRALYRKELRQLPEGNLVIRQQENGRFYFYEKRDGQERGITKKKVHASWLARKMFLEKCLDAAELECRVLSGALKQLEQLIYQTKSGIMVRSKSERMIADFLTEQLEEILIRFGVEILSGIDIDQGAAA